MREAPTLDALLAMNSEQLAQRVKMGDHLERARPIEHFAYFGGGTQARAAATELRDDGFDVDVRRTWFTWHLTARTESSLEPDTAEGFVLRMFDLIRRHGGDYDGWGGPLSLGDV